MARDLKKIVNYLRLYRRKKGLSQKKMADLMGFRTTSSISNYERGNKLPYLINLLKLEVICRTPIAFLFRGHIEKLKKEILKKEQRLQKKEQKERG